MDWTHFSGDVNQTNLAASYPSPFGTKLNQPLTVIGQNRLDQVNLVLGQHADFGLVKKMRFFGGMQYANIQAFATNYFSTTFPVNPAGITAISQFDNADFKGFGPVVGIDYAYELSSEFSLTAHGAGSILYGTGRYSAGYTAAPINLVYTSVYGKNRFVVPSLEAKLGMNYAYSLAQGIINIEGGYQSLNYFNALQTQGLNGITGALTSSDYGLYGPYLGLKYIGNV